MDINDNQIWHFADKGLLASVRELIMRVDDMHELRCIFGIIEQTSGTIAE